MSSIAQTRRRNHGFKTTQHHSNDSTIDKCPHTLTHPSSDGYGLRGLAVAGGLGA